MSEVSREAIAYFKKRIEAEKQIINLPTCDKEVAESKKKHIAYFEQAISDMEKLQKIEELYEPKEFGKGLLREERDMEVQKILEV